MPVVNEVIANKPGFRPVLVDFQNGKIKPGEERNLDSSLYRSEKKETVVSVTSGKMLYTGTVDSENDLYNNFIVVHDKQHEKMDESIGSKNVRSSKAFFTQLQEEVQTHISNKIKNKKTKRNKEQIEAKKIKL